VRFDPRADLLQVEVLEALGDLDRALRIADRDMLKRPLVTGRLEVSAAVLGAAAILLLSRRSRRRRISR